MNQRPNWREQPSPLIPIYFIDINHLREVLENGGISDFGLELLLGYYEEFEMYEKAAVIQKYIGGYDIDVEVFKGALENPPVAKESRQEVIRQEPKSFDPFSSENPFA